MRVDQTVGRIVKHAQSQGWTVVPTSNMRLKFCSPDLDVPPVFVSQKLQPGRSLANVLAVLARAGLDDMPGGNPRYQDPIEEETHMGVNGSSNGKAAAVKAAKTVPVPRNIDDLLLEIRIGVESLLSGAEDGAAWREIAEELERRVGIVEAERDEALARADKAEGRLAALRDALSG